MVRHLYSRSMRGLCVLVAFLAATIAILAFGAQSLPAPPSQERAPFGPPAARGVEINEPSALARAKMVPQSASVAFPLTGQCHDPTAGGGGDPLSREERERNRKAVDLIARELGVDASTRRLLVRWSVRESNSDPAAVGTLPPDVRVASSARARGVVESLGQSWGPQWAYGRGLYGMIPAYFVGYWDPRAHPDVLCDPVVATVVVVWAARSQQRECVRRGYPPTQLVSNRRYGSGHCKPREFDHKAIDWWADRGRDITTEPARWGSRWPEQTTDRAAVYAHMREKLHAANLAGILDDAPAGE